MGKLTSFLIGTVIGVAGAAVWNYLFAPAQGTTLDEQYQTRLGWALAEGERAGIQREAELRAELKAVTGGQRVE